MPKKQLDFSYDFAEDGGFFTTSWTAKSIEFKKYHFKEVIEEMRLENLLNERLEIKIEEHGLLKHPLTIRLKPKEIKHIKIKIPCNKIDNKHKSFLVLKTKNQTEKVLIKIEHIK